MLNVRTRSTTQLDAWKSAVHNNEDAILENNGDMVSVAPTAADTVDSEWRTVVKLDLQIGNKHLTDQFEWPLIAATSPAGNQLPMPNPESYARQLCAELGIGGEFVVDVAHSIREQICYARMNFEEVSKMYNIPVPPLRVGDHAEDWGPAMEELSDGEIESRQKELERTARYAGDVLISFLLSLTLRLRPSYAHSMPTLRHTP